MCSLQARGRTTSMSEGTNPCVHPRRHGFSRMTCHSGCTWLSHLFPPTASRPALYVGSLHREHHTFQGRLMLDFHVLRLASVDLDTLSSRYKAIFMSTLALQVPPLVHKPPRKHIRWPSPQSRDLSRSLPSSAPRTRSIGSLAAAAPSSLLGSTQSSAQTL